MPGSVFIRNLSLRAAHTARPLCRTAFTPAPCDRDVPHPFNPSRVLHAQLINRTLPLKPASRALQNVGVA